ncbi:MAG: hypothetical protein ACYCV0_10965 [Desulfitobacteriaceae bacterium]
MERGFLTVCKEQKASGVQQRGQTGVVKLTSGSMGRREGLF